MGGAANHWNWQTWRWSESTLFCAPTLETRYGKKAIPAEMAIQDWGHHLCRNGVLSRSVREAVRHCRQCRKSAWQGAGGRKSVRGTAAETSFRKNPLPITEAGLIFSEATKKLGYKPFPMPAANSPEAYTNPDGMQLGQLPVLRPL